MLTLNPKRHEVKINGKTLTLSRKEFLIAKYALENKGFVWTREDAIANIWKDTHKGFGTRTVDQHIARLRGKLGKTKFLTTVFGFGYKAVDGKIVNG